MKALMMTVALLLAAVGAAAQQSPSSVLMTKAFADIPGKEGTMITVEYAPGASGQVHRHNAHVFVYVFEGQIVMQVQGGKEQVLSPGQTFYESPSDVHSVGRNASTSKPAKFLVFMVKDTGAPVSVPVH